MAASLASLEARLGNDAKSFFGAGFSVAVQAIPRGVVPLYRRGLNLLARERFPPSLTRLPFGTSPYTSMMDSLWDLF